MSDESLLSLVESGQYEKIQEHIPYSAYLGLRLYEESGDRRYAMPFQEKFLGNPEQRLLHGGVIAGFMENAAIFQVLIQQRQRRIPKPIDFSIDYIRPGADVECHADVDVVREGNRVVLARVDCWQNDINKLIAQARIHFLLEKFSA